MTTTDYRHRVMTTRMPDNAVLRQACDLAVIPSIAGSTVYADVLRREEAIMLSFADRVLGLHLGLGDLQPAPICMTYACACVCERCSDRAERVEALKDHPRAAAVAASDSAAFFLKWAA